MPRDDEEGIVHADAQPDEEHQLGRDRGHADAMAEHADDTDGGAQREQRGDDGEDGCEDGAEDEEQHDQGEQDAETRAAEGLVVGLLGQLTGDGDRQAVAGGPGDGVDEGLRLAARDVVGLFVEKDLQEPNRPVCVDVRGAHEVARGVVGARHGRHVGQRVNLVHHLVDAQTDVGVGQAGVTGGSEDHLFGVPGMSRCHGLQQVDGLEGLGVGELEVVRIARADRRHDEDGAHENCQPQEDDDAAMTDTPPGQGAH